MPFPVLLLLLLLLALILRRFLPRSLACVCLSCVRVRWGLGEGEEDKEEMRKTRIEGG